jgi:hypothetical protein
VATKKQRRRREKEKRHEYEIVYLDDEGNEVDPGEVEVQAPARKGSASNSKAAGKRSSAGSRGRRTPQPPSWKRVAKRGAIFAPLFVGTVLILGGKSMTLAAALFQTLVLLVFFVPFSYFLDSFMWRSYQKRQARGAPVKR